MKVIVNSDRFSLKVLSDDLSGELAEVYIVVAGQHVSGRNPVFIPTFVGELNAFLESQKSQLSDVDFSRLSDAEAFSLFHTVSQTGEATASVTPSDVWNHYRLHSIGDAVDDWEIYVFDIPGRKRFVCREQSADTQHKNQLLSTVIPSEDFNHTLEEFIALFPDR